MKHRAFTLIELLIVVAILLIFVIGFGVIGTGLMGNYWYTHETVLDKLQVNHPEIVEVIDSNRNVWGRSEIIAEDSEGNRHTFLLDTNILFNHELEEQN